MVKYEVISGKNTSDLKIKLDNILEERKEVTLGSLCIMNGSFFQSITYKEEPTVKPKVEPEVKKPATRRRKKA